MGWTRYYEASDQHTVGTKKKKPAAAEVSITSSPERPLSLAGGDKTQDKVLGKGDHDWGGCSHELWGGQSCLSLQPFILLLSACPRSVPTALALPE